MLRKFPSSTIFANETDLRCIGRRRDDMQAVIMAFVVDNSHKKLRCS